MTDSVTVRHLEKADAAPIAAAFRAIGWNKPEAQYLRYFDEQEKGKRIVIVALTGGTFAGYVTVLWVSGYVPFSHAGIPEICDFNVLPQYRRQGIGTMLMAEAERLIAVRSAIAGIGVGMTSDYGAAQRLYFQRGYVPDGRGLCSHGKPVVWGDTITVDDDLVLYFTKG
jgi:ribosomal protein S18 acetylase RimI-like enzyme